MKIHSGLVVEITDKGIGDCVGAGIGVVDMRLNGSVQVGRVCLSIESKKGRRKYVLKEDREEKW